jgi:hypothetical protein
MYHKLFKVARSRGLVIREFTKKEHHNQEKSLPLGLSGVEGRAGKKIF